ncbi:hypothetical protein M426DRAFT_325388 [Hypoxylon sp. CI-4A]|nr:hypothetical protein M426DRAFT_325388 [Hypoxylon sp. CI-4A]
MDIPLQAPNPPVNLLGDHVSQTEIKLIVRCHDPGFKDTTILDSAGQTIFKATGTAFGTSWSLRRKLWDSVNDRHVFDFRHNSFDLKNGWVVESPDGQKICSLEHKTQITSEHSNIDATVRTKAGEQVLVAMRQNDYSALITTVRIGDATIASIHKVEDNVQRFKERAHQDRSVWEVRVAPGVDLSLVMVMVLCRVEMCHVWQQ